MRVVRKLPRIASWYDLYMILTILFTIKTCWSNSTLFRSTYGIKRFACLILVNEVFCLFLIITILFLNLVKMYIKWTFNYLCFPCGAESNTSNVYNDLLAISWLCLEVQMLFDNLEDSRRKWRHIIHSRQI